MYCRQCGAELRQTIKYCPDCGCNMTSEVDEQVHSMKHDKSRVTMWLIILTLLIIGSFGLIYSNFLSDKQVIKSTSTAYEDGESDANHEAEMFKLDMGRALNFLHEGDKEMIANKHDESILQYHMSIHVLNEIEQRYSDKRGDIYYAKSLNYRRIAVSEHKLGNRTNALKYSSEGVNAAKQAARLGQPEAQEELTDNNMEW